MKWILQKKSWSGKIPNPRNFVAPKRHTMLILIKISPKSRLEGEVSISIEIKRLPPFYLNKKEG